MRDTTLLAVCTFSLALACGGRGSGFDDGGGGGDGGGVDGDLGDGSCSFCGIDSGKNDGGGPQTTCSPDLHDILDLQGNVVQTCPPDQGCSPGGCVPACQAAAAAHGSIGCDFMVATPSFFAGLQPTYSSPCFAIFIANNWSKDTVLGVDRSGTSYDPTKFGRISATGVAPASWGAVANTGVPQGKVAVLFMDDNPSYNYPCPVTPASTTTTGLVGTGRGQAWHITTSFPVSAYDILPFGGASSFLPGATLLYPTSAWGINYIAALPKLGSGSNAGSQGPHWGQIVAYQSGTTVDIVPTVALPSGTGVSAAPANMKTTYTLNAGEFVQWEPGFNYPGRRDRADGHVGLDHLVEQPDRVQRRQRLPVPRLGDVDERWLRLRPRADRADPGARLDLRHRSVRAARADTPRTRSRCCTASPAWSTARRSRTTRRRPACRRRSTWARWSTSRAKAEFVVKSQDAQHPFHVAIMMSGCSGTSDIGDEDYGQMVPPAQFLSSYVFYSDVTYQTTNFTVVRNKTSSGLPRREHRLRRQRHRLEARRQRPTRTSTRGSTSSRAAPRSTTTARTARTPRRARARSASPCGAKTARIVRLPRRRQPLDHQHGRGPARTALRECGMWNVEPGTRNGRGCALAFHIPIPRFAFHISSHSVDASPTGGGLRSTCAGGSPYSRWILRTSASTRTCSW